MHLGYPAVPLVQIGKMRSEKGVRRFAKILFPWHTHVRVAAARPLTEACIILRLLQPLSARVPWSAD